MKGMILAAGLGTRLRPLTDTIPKPLVKVRGRYLIHYPLSLLKKNGIEEVIINLHHHGDAVARALGDGRDLGMSLTYSHEPEILGTGGGLKKAQEFFGDSAFVVINADTIMDADIEEIEKSHKANKAAATMVVKSIPDWKDYGAVEADENLRVRRIRGLPKMNLQQTLKPYVFTGLHILEPEILEHIPVGKYASIIKQGYIPLIEGNRPVLAYVTSGLWMTVDDTEKLNQAQKNLKKGLSYF